MNHGKSQTPTGGQCAITCGRASPGCPILETISEGVITVDPNKRIQSFNRAAEAIAGFSRQEAAGQFCFDVFRGDICDGKCLLDKTRRFGRPQHDIPAFIITKTGQHIPVSVSTAALRHPVNHITGMVAIFRDISELETLRKHFAKSFAPTDILGKTPQITKIFSFLPDIADSDSAVLLEGPTGSGKEVFARAIHHQSGRQKGPFVAINCSALPDTLLASELFGYKKGAFTGALKDKPGRFMLAHQGTLLLDEICSTSTAFQADLLRVLETGEFTPLGHIEPVRVDFRLLAATHSDLRQLIDQGQFREDLYYRLNVVKITLPPLKDRKADIPILADHFVHKYNLLKGKAIQGVSQDVMSALMAYPFPGNVRELENMIEYAFILCKGDQIQIKHLPEDFRHWLKTKGITVQEDQKGDATRVIHQYIGGR